MWSSLQPSKGEHHLTVLRRVLVFYRLMPENQKKNPDKLVFGVNSGKLLGFSVSQRGIEVEPEKKKAIQDMPPPKKKKEVTSILGKIELHCAVHLTANSDF